jgi:Tol biopolymer transport system component
MEPPRVQSLYSVRPDGSGVERLTNRLGQAGNPVWSPDGRRIAFDAWDENESRVYVMSSDGSDLKLLESGPSASGPGVPAWSPDGTRIAFLRTPGTPGAFTAEIWVLNADGTEPRRLFQSTCCIATWGRPVWSPDGRHVAFGVGLNGDPENSGVYAVRADGTDLRRIATAPAEPAWQRLP